MNEEYDDFQKKMHELYPRAFNQPYGGFAVGSGWHTILGCLVANIEHHISWKRGQRARDLRKVRAKNRGFEHLVKFYQGKRETPSDWNLTQAEEDMENELDVTDKVEHIRVQQIKEKFGGLRFYYEGGDREVSGMVTMAEAWAARTCETCGDRGKQRSSGGWVRTLCDKHEAEYQERIKDRK